MIGAIFGTLRDIKGGVANVITNGVSYEIHVSEPDINWEQMDPVDRIGGADGNYWTHQHFPQDAAPELYGFRQREQRDMFRRLLKIKGVGPKVAMRIVAAYPVTSDMSRWIADDLTKIRGVGATLAQRICEELS